MSTLCMAPSQGQVLPAVEGGPALLAACRVNTSRHSSIRGAADWTEATEPLYPEAGVPQGLVYSHLFGPSSGMRFAGVQVLRIQSVS
jgi:hypothetical protein